MTCFRPLAPFLVALGILSFAYPAAAQNTVRIVQQFGISYLPLLVALDRKLIESKPRDSASLTPRSRSCGWPAAQPPTMRSSRAASISPWPG